MSANPKMRMTPDTTAVPADIWCAIPVFNNAGTVRTVACSVREVLPHVVVVDDGSTDADVGALLADVGVTVLRHAVNRGKGCALLTALQHVQAHGGRFLISLDADGQHHPDDICRMLPALAADPDAIVIGVRRMEGPHVPASSRFGRRFSDFWVRLETGLDVRDSQSGFRAYPVALTRQLPLRSRRFDFEIEVLAQAAWAGLHIRHVNVDVTYAARGERISHFRPFLDNLRLTHRHVLLVLRRLLPWPHRRLVPREARDAWELFRHPVLFVRQFLRERSSPAELGAAAGVGVLLGALPLLALHSVSIVYVTTRLNLNRLMALASQNLCVPPFVPLLCVEIGYFLRHGCWLHEMSRETLWHQAPARIGEWLLGSLLVAPLLALATGLAVFGLAAAVRRRTGTNPRKESA